MKSLISSSLFLLLSSAALNADEIGLQSSREQSSSDCCPKPKPCCPPRLDCCPPRCAQLVGGVRGEVLPNAGPCVACGMDVFVTADFIYWSVREDHLGFVASAPAPGTASVNPTHTKVFQPDFKMRPGFKVALGMGFDHDGWDSLIQYTWIQARNNKGSATPSSTSVLSDDFWGFGTDNGTIDSVSINWQLHYFNVIDWELGRNFYVSRYLTLRPHFGLKGTWQKQFYLLSANETDTSGLAPVVIGDSITDIMNQKQFFWGVGIRAGLDTAWHFSRSFSAVGEIAFSGLYGQFENSSALSNFDNTQGFFLVNAVVSNNFHTIKPVVEWFLGLRWETYTCDNEYHFSLEAGWEEQFWGEQNQLIISTSEGKNGDLNFQGLTVKARFDF